MEVSIERVRERVILGGHGIPEDTIRRRYQRGLENFFRLYQPIADSWQVYENDSAKEPRLITEGSGTMERVVDDVLWHKICTFRQNLSSRHQFHQAFA